MSDYRCTEFYLSPNLPPKREFFYLSKATEWKDWLSSQIDETWSDDGEAHIVRSNLRHVLAGLEMKAGLLRPHWAEDKPLLFEPYARIMAMEFCVGVFSLCEGLGAHLRRVDSEKIGCWNKQLKKLCARYDPDGKGSLQDKACEVKKVRDLLHNDLKRPRNGTNFGELSAKAAFNPAVCVLNQLFDRDADRVPKSTNLRSPQS